MLVLSRKVGEKIEIGDNITIVVNRISGNRVALGIHAPKDVRVVRGELERFEDEVGDSSQTASGPPCTVPTPILIDDVACSTFLPRNAR